MSLRLGGADESAHEPAINLGRDCIDVDTLIAQEGPRIVDAAYEKLDIGDAGFPLILAREGEHFVRHVETVDFACRANASCGQQHINSTAGAKIENGFARIQGGERRGIAAAERSFQRFFRYLCCLSLVIETRRDG